jgi:transposase-like protein
MERWSVEHRAFAVETYFKNKDSVVLTQRIFRRHFNIHRNDSFPSRNTLLLWVKNFRETASAEAVSLKFLY